MSTVSRWEKERAAWLLARSRPGTSRRRKAELLARQARHLGRKGTSAGQSALHDDATDSLFRRLLKSDEGSGDKLARLVLVPVVFGAAWLLAGAAIALSMAVYRALWTRAPRSGRLRMWPWLIVGAAVAAAGWFLLDRRDLIVLSVWPRYLLVDVDWLRLGLVWGWIQLSIGLILTGLRIRSEGWAGVPTNAVPRRETDRDGSFRETPQRQKVRLDPLAGVEPEPELVFVDEEDLEPTLSDDEISTELPDDEPDFNDNDDDLVFIDEDEALNDTDNDNTTLEMTR